MNMVEIVLCNVTYWRPHRNGCLKLRWLRQQQ